MATTTTFNPTSDSFIQSDNATTNYGSNAQFKLGEVGSSGNAKHGVIEFDVSSITNHKDIVSANFTLVSLWASTGSVTKTMTVARLKQSYTEGTVTWNTYDGTNAWPGGAGAAGDADTGTPTYSITVGEDVDQVIDIVELVKDAIIKRSGTLRIVIYMVTTGSDCNNNFGSSENGTPSNRPTIDVVTADRYAWAGDFDDDLDNYRNWNPLTVPGDNDIAIFNSGSVDATRGSITSKRIYIGRNYKGNIGTSSSIVAFNCDDLRLNSRYSSCYLLLNNGVGTNTSVRVSDTSGTSGSMILDGEYDVILTRTRSQIEMQTADVGSIDAGQRVSFTADEDVATVRLRGSVAILEDGAGSLTAANGSIVTVRRVNNDETTISISESRVRCQASTIDVATIYSGSIKFNNNEGSPIVCDGLIVYPGGLADTRTGSATFTSTAALSMYGGRVYMDPTQNVSIT